MQKVDFFIVGAPKYGTTSLSEYLREHPEICFSDPKEPDYFDDLSRDCFYGTEEEYHKIFFSHCTSEKIRGEGSTWYLYSQKAIPNIMKYNPEARIIVMLRNPVEMVHSLHSHLVFSCDEDERDFKKAWNLQDLRREQKHIPKTDYHPAAFLYAEVAGYSRQLEALYRNVPKKQVMVILFDDFIADTKGVYKDVLEFLDVSTDFVPSFEIINPAKVSRSRLIAKVFHKPPNQLTVLARRLRKKLGLRTLGIRPLLNLLNTRAQKRPPLDENMKETLRNTFREDIQQLGKLLGRDLSHWLDN